MKYVRNRRTGAIWHAVCEIIEGKDVIRVRLWWGEWSEVSKRDYEIIEK
jgi:hypothetical protein